jgi:outer membrane cobalamin receptor
MGRKLAYFDKMHGKLRVRWKPITRTAVEAELFYSGPRYSENGTRLGEATCMNLTASYRLDSATALFLRIKNLADADSIFYRDASDGAYTFRPRAVSVGIVRTW